MWAWDATNDKIYMGLNGTWFNSGDPVAGTGIIITGEDLSASSYYFKLGYTADGGTPTLTTVTSGNSGSSSSLSKEGDAEATTFNPFNTDINTVRGQESGYATLNPLVYRANDSGQSGTAATFSDGNLTVSGGQTNDRIAANMSFKIGDSGKYFWEIFWEGIPASSNGAGIRDYSAGTATQVLKLWYYDASTTDGGPATTFKQGDTLGFALNTATGNIDCFKDGKKVGSMDASSLTEVTPFISMNSGVKVNANFGQKPFKFPSHDPSHDKSPHLQIDQDVQSQFLDGHYYSVVGNHQVVGT